MTAPAIILDASQLWTLLLCSTRYAMGRSSYIVGTIGDMLVQYAPELTEQQRAQLVWEIREELGRAEKRGTTLGMDMDHAQWQRTAARLEVMR